MRRAEYQPDEDERALLDLLPAGGSAADSHRIRSQLDWDGERYAHARARLEEQGYVLAGHGRDETVCRDLTAAPPELRPPADAPARVSSCAGYPSRSRMLNKGQDAITPIALPDDIKSVRFFSDRPRSSRSSPATASR